MPHTLEHGAAAKPEVPDYTLLSCIGAGSYGRVWLARSVTGQYRAVKVVYRSSFTDDHPFDREFAGVQNYEPLSRAHPALVPVLHVGINREAGYFYYVMEAADDCVHGRDIDPPAYVPRTLTAELRRRKRLPVDECLEIGLALSGALDVLHRNGRVHRDITLSNIIFVDGTAKLADVGLVARTAGVCSFVGTEGYVPREGPGTPCADVFSLGKVLYELMTGQDRLDFPRLPADADALVAGDPRYRALNAVVLKACDGNADRRLPGARQLHDALLSVRQQAVSRRGPRLPWGGRRSRAKVAATGLPAPAAPPGRTSDPSRDAMGPARLPVYMMLDCSASMRGSPLAAATATMGKVVRLLGKWHTPQTPLIVTLITYRLTALQYGPLRPVNRFTLPATAIDAGGASVLTGAFQQIENSMEHELTRPGAEDGDARPMVLCFTDRQVCEATSSARFKATLELIKHVDIMVCATDDGHASDGYDAAIWLSAHDIVFLNDPRITERVDHWIARRIQGLRENRRPILYPSGYHAELGLTPY